jgi:hypothetical protein
MLERNYNLANRLDYHMQIKLVKQLQQLDLDHTSNKKLSNPKHQRQKHMISKWKETRLQSRST